MDPADLPPLDTYSKEEWFAVGCELDPTLTRERFEAMWLEFYKTKIAN